MTTDYSWNKYIVDAHTQMMNENDTRELGKIRAAAAEYLAMDWINSNTKIKVQRGAEAVNGHSDKNGSGYDLICEETGLRIQVKYRSGDFHLETTRRNSIKNIGNASQTGHVAYSVNECDVFLFVVPNYNSSNPMDSEFIAIPSSALEDPNNPTYCVPRISKKLIGEYKNRASEVLETAKVK